MLRRESKRASRSGRPLSLLFLDLDGFKSVNDRHGHLCGSRALVEAAGVIRGCARETDVAARFGGDEFAVGAARYGQRGCGRGRRTRARADCGALVSEGQRWPRHPIDGVRRRGDAARCRGSAEELIKAADTAMYRVKDRGKNGVVLAIDRSNYLGSEISDLFKSSVDQ